MQLIHKQNRAVSFLFKIKAFPKSSIPSYFNKWCNSFNDDDFRKTKHKYLIMFIDITFWFLFGLSEKKILTGVFRIFVYYFYYFFSYVLHSLLLCKQFSSVFEILKFINILNFNEISIHLSNWIFTHLCLFVLAVFFSTFLFINGKTPTLPRNQ